jgi:hypothetical protein
MVLAIGIHRNDTVHAARRDGLGDARAQRRALAGVPRVAQQPDARRRGGARKNRVVGGAAAIIDKRDGLETRHQEGFDEPRQRLRWPIGRNHHRDARRARASQLFIKTRGRRVPADRLSKAR